MSDLDILPGSQHGQHGPPSSGICNNVLITLRAEISVVRLGLDSLKERVAENEARQVSGQDDIDGHVDGLRERIREVHDKVKDLILEQHKSYEQLIKAHADEDNKAMREIREQLLARVPAWALALLSAGAAVIGSLGTYILDHIR